MVDPLERLVETIRLHDGDSVAVSGRFEALTYGQLLSTSRALAAEFRSALNPSRPVVVVAERCDPKTVSTLLGLWLDDRVPLLLGSETPRERIEKAARTIEASGIVHVGREIRVLSGESDGAASRCPDPAYFVMTSGTTAEPKIVLCRWQGLELVANQLRTRYKMEASSRVLQFASPSYDAFLAETVPVLLAGGTIVCLDDGSWTTPRKVLHSLVDYSVTHATFPPSYLKRLFKDEVTHRLQVLVSAGEALDVSLATAALASTELLINAYGPCEATVCTMTYVVRGDEAIIPLGQPLSGVDVEVVDGALRISGPTVAWGYVGEQDPGGFGQGPDDRGSFLTGDEVLQVGSEVAFKGRSDRQIKVDGHRLDLSGIEDIICSIDGVSDCAIVAREGTIFAVVATEREIAAIEAAARRHLLPAECPRWWRSAKQIPYLTSDKLDVVALMELFNQSGRPASFPSPNESRVAEVWERRAALTQGASTDFFAAGGSSLEAMALLDDVYSELGVDLDLADFLAEPTFGALLDKLGTSPCDG